MENLISELTRCMNIIEKNRGNSRFKNIDNVFYFAWSVSCRKKSKEDGSTWQILKFSFTPCATICASSDLQSEKRPKHFVMIS